MTVLELQCLAIWKEALGASVGLRVGTNDPTRARAQMYKVRTMIGDVDLSSLMIRVSPDDTEGEIWILRNAAHVLDLKATEIDPYA
jgi:hypothetical protein